jgi:hypothetical protein
VQGIQRGASFIGEHGCFQNVPPDWSGTWQTYADVCGHQKRVSPGEKEKSRTLVERYGLEFGPLTGITKRAETRMNT